MIGKHPKQDAFVLDRSPKIAAVAGRRGGKSVGLGRKFHDAALRNPGEKGLYVVQSRESAKGIIWDPLRRISEEIGLELEFKEHTGDVIWPNGFRLMLRGGGSVREIDKYRGMSYVIIGVDEAQLFGPSLGYLIREVVEPSMLDYGVGNAQLCLTGTPNAACAGPFFDLVHDFKNKIPVYHWTALNNPYVVNPEQFLAERAAEYGKDSFAFRREYLGEWARDDSALVFRINPTLNTIDDWEPDEDWEYTLGVDFGYNDPTAFVVLAYNESIKRGVVVEAWEETELTQATIARYIHEMNDRYHFTSIVGDSAAKQLIQGLNQEHGLNVLPAQKTAKAAHIALLNSDLATGALLFQAGATDELVSQLRILQWDPNKAARGRFEVMSRDKRFPDHMADALVYAWRDARLGGDYEADRDAPPKGSRDWWRSIEDDIVRKAEKSLERDESSWFD